MVNNKLVAGTFARSIQSFRIDSLFPKNITSIQQEKNYLENVNVFPNPSNNVIFIDNLFVKTKIIMYNALGEIVKQTTTIKKQHKIDISELNDGSYFVHFENEKRSRVFKIIKQ